GAGDRGVVIAADETRIEALNGRGLHEVERLALRHAIDDVEQDDVAQMLQAGEQGERAADLPGAHQRDLAACHAPVLSESGSWKDAAGLARFYGPGKGPRANPGERRCNRRSASR